MLGVLIMNTGTPDAPTPEAIRPYLKEFLSDRNIVDCPSFIWKPVLNLFILPRRPKVTAPHYAHIWTPQGSPFLLTSFAQATGIENHLASLIGGPVMVRAGMRYGNPSIARALDEMAAAGVDEVVALPLYPQATRACSGTCFKELDRCLAERASSWNPQVHRIDHYWDAPAYMAALAASVRRAWTHGSGGKLVVSFHSLPVSYAAKGDTYAEDTKETARRLAEALDISQEDVLVTYQSRFDSRKWLGPFLEPELERLAREGVRDVAVVCPVFSADCIETLYEVKEEAAEAYLRAAREAGFDDARFTYVPALGADEAFLEAVAHLIAARV